MFFKLLHADTCLSVFALMKATSKEECFELGTEYVEICVDLNRSSSCRLDLAPKAILLLICIRLTLIINTAVLSQRRRTPSCGPYGTPLGNILNVGC